MFPKESSLRNMLFPLWLYFFRMGPVTECPPSVLAQRICPRANPLGFQGGMPHWSQDTCPRRGGRERSDRWKGEGEALSPPRRLGKAKSSMPLRHYPAPFFPFYIPSLWDKLDLPSPPCKKVACSLHSKSWFKGFCSIIGLKR